MELEKLFKEINHNLESSRKIFIKTHLDDDEEDFRTLDEAKIVLSAIEKIGRETEDCFKEFNSLESIFEKEFGSFSIYIWGFVNNKPIKNSYKTQAELLTNSSLSDKISKDLKKRGFKFVGTTIIYAYLQAIGIVSDHIEACFRHH